MDVFGKHSLIITTMTSGLKKKQQPGLIMYSTLYLYTDS